MKQFKHLMEALPSKTVVFAFGRFNPPTSGHELLIKLVKKLAKANSADYVIYASRSQDKKKNPLSVDRKLHYLRLMFPNTNFAGATDEQRTFIEVAKFLNKKYKNLIMVAGSDRIPEYERILNTYNGKEFHFDSIKVISAGERDPDADDASGMSASKLRGHAAKGDFAQFKKGMPSSVREIDARQLMNDIRVGMGMDVIKEQIKLGYNELRERYLAKEIFNIGDFVESAGHQYEIIDRGTNYLTVVDAQGSTHRKWLQECKLVEYVAEDITSGYAPSEVTFKGYTTKNLHHSADAAKAFEGTIQRHGASDPASVLAALKATDAYMKLNDMHLEQGKAPDEKELGTWKAAHAKAKESLDRLGEFLHHMDYWHNHQHEIEAMETQYNPETAGAEMSDSYTPEGTMVQEELTDKTIKSGDKVKVARVIADMLGVDNAESMSPENAVNAGLRKIKTKRMTPEFVGVIKKMLDLAKEVGIKYDHNMAPKAVSEAVVVNKNSTYNMAQDILRYKDFMKLKKVSEKEDPQHDVNLEDPEAETIAALQSASDIHGPNADDDVPSAQKIAADKLEKQGEKHTAVGHSLDGTSTSDQVRRMKVAYKTEAAEMRPYEMGQKVDYVSVPDLSEKKKKVEKEGVIQRTGTDKITEDLHTADYKVNPQTGRKYRAKHIEFANSKMGSNPSDVEDRSEDEVDDSADDTIRKPKAKHQFIVPAQQNVKEEVDQDEMTDDELDAIANSVSDADDVLDAYDDEELVIVDADTGEQVDQVKEETEQLNEVLSRMERMKAKIRFARTASKRERRLQVALKTRSSATKINARARRLAISLMKQRMIKKPVDKMTVSEKERAEAIIARRKNAINRLAMKLAPRIRKIENERLSHAKVTK